MTWSGRLTPKFSETATRTLRMRVPLDRAPRGTQPARQREARPMPKLNGGRTLVLAAITPDRTRRLT